MGHEARDYYNRFNDVAYPPQRQPPKSANIATPSNIVDPAWYMGSGATNHFTSTLKDLFIQSEYQGSDALLVGNSMQLPISGIGIAILNTISKPLVLNKALHVPQIK